MKVKCLSILFQQKRNSKIGACGDLALSGLYSTKKMIPSLLSCYLKLLARLNDILKKLILRKTRNKVFLIFLCNTPQDLFIASVWIYCALIVTMIPHT